MTSAEAEKYVDDLISSNHVMLFSKMDDTKCKKVKDLFFSAGIPFMTLEFDRLDTDQAKTIMAKVKKRSEKSGVPIVFVGGDCVGGLEDLERFAQEKKSSLIQTIDIENTVPKEFDLLIIGGGSGGISAAKEAGKLGKRVALCDYVRPSPIGTTWGLGGTCVNVGCIPKKLFHQAALLGTALEDAPSFGWQTNKKCTHDWKAMVNGIHDYILSLNWGYRVALKNANVTYFNEYAEFLNSKSVITTNKKGQKQILKADNIIVAVGGRPKYPDDCPGAVEFGITSDDLFSLPYNPGKTLLVGASYIALECAGFLQRLGIECTVMVRSVLLRGFDQQMAQLIGQNMADEGIKFMKGWVPTSIIKIKAGIPGKLLVNAKEVNGPGTTSLEVNTVVFAVGRDPCTKAMRLDLAGVELSPKTGRILTNDRDQTNISNIYAIGDVAEGRPELTPVAIEAGHLLAKRLYDESSLLMDYINVPTVVFTPLEYGSCGLSEETAIEKYGAKDIEVYHTFFQPLESALPKRDDNKCYVKLICVKSKNELVVGFHYLGPNAGEVIQGYGIGIKLGAKKSDFNSLVGIHPTNAEIFTTMRITKSSGVPPQRTGC